MTILEWIEGLIIAVGAIMLGLFKLLGIKQKSAERVTIAQIKKDNEDIKELKAEIKVLLKEKKEGLILLKEGLIREEELKNRARGYLDTMEICVIRVEEIKNNFAIIAPYLRKSMESTPESMRAFIEFEKIIKENREIEPPKM